MGEVGYEGRSTVTDHFLWESVMVPDMFQEQLGNSGGIQGGDCGYGMNPFRQVIHHHEGGIVPLGVQEFSDHVYRDHLSALVRDLVGDQLPHLLCQEGLCLVACPQSLGLPQTEEMFTGVSWLILKLREVSSLSVGTIYSFQKRSSDQTYVNKHKQIL